MLESPDRVDHHVDVVLLAIRRSHVPLLVEVEHNTARRVEPVLVLTADLPVHHEMVVR